MMIDELTPTYYLLLSTYYLLLLPLLSIALGSLNLGAHRTTSQATATDQPRGGSEPQRPAGEPAGQSQSRSPLTTVGLLLSSFGRGSGTRIVRRSTDVAITTTEGLALARNIVVVRSARGVNRHSDKHAPGHFPEAQDAFKGLMIHWILQVARRIAFRCVLHRCGNQDIRR